MDEWTDELMNGSLDECVDGIWTHIQERLMDDHQIDQRYWLDKQQID